MKKILLSVLALVMLAGCATTPTTPETTPTPSVQPTAPADAETGATSDATTSASIVVDELVKEYTPKGFTDAEVEKVLFVVGDPRHNSVTWDLANTAMAYFEEKGMEVELRDLYAMNFNPVLSVENFYYAKDGAGEPTAEIKAEQELVTAADHIIFVYPNWHDSEIAIVKGYKEEVFAKKFAYQDSESGLEGLLKDKSIYTIMNCGYLGGGRGWIGDGIIDTETWDKYMNAFDVFDQDTAAFWGVTSYGRYVNDRTPANTSENYAEELKELEDNLITHLDKVYFSKN